jgi:hypothetical protein
LKEVEYPPALIFIIMNVLVKIEAGNTNIQWMILQQCFPMWNYTALGEPYYPALYNND